MEFLQKSELPQLYRGHRRPYLSYVIDIIKENGWKSILEIGPYDHPVVKGCDTMDIIEHIPMTYKQDAGEPWEIDKHRDCIISLQTFEHLNGKQKHAFDEIKHHADNAILSLPYRHHCPGDCHHAIDERVIRQRTGIEPTKTKIIGDKIVCFYNFTNKPGLND